jgi:tetraacyldisaccharide 4'-kinase
MNFNSFFLKSFRALLLPFALVYGLVVIIRNYLYDKKIIKFAEFNIPVICVGNLVVGGTGKSPMVEYLLELLHKQFNLATLSRGYKRKTKGYVVADENTTALDIGDEPMQFYLKYPDVKVAAGEERIVTIPQLLYDHYNTEVIILDDAFQHREIKAGFNILLTQFGNLYSHDFFLPAGDLRDEWRSAKRAQIIIVTKCPADLKETQQQKILKSLNVLPAQQVFFTTIEYGTPYHILNRADEWVLTPTVEVLLVCGIANPGPLKDYLHQHTYTYYQKTFSDHHIFSIDDLNEIEDMFDDISTKNKIILTTEKDAVRLVKFNEELKDIPIYVLPIKSTFLFNEEQKFNDMVISFIKNFTAPAPS